MRIDRPVPAEVQPAVNHVALLNRWESACGKEQRAEKSLAEIRLEKGRILKEARAAFPKSGPRAKGWGELLRKWKCDEDTALNYMKLAGYVDSDDFPKTSGNPIPTYAEAGITKTRPQRASDDEPNFVPTQLEDFKARDFERENRSPSDTGAWMSRVEQLAEELHRHTKAMFAVAQELDALCTQHEASVGSPSLMTARSMLAGVKASVADALQLMGGTNGERRE